MSHPDRPVLLDLWLHGKRLGTILAAAYRADLEAAGIGRGYCSFRFATQSSIPAQSIRHLTICRSADGAALPMTPDLRAQAA